MQQIAAVLALCVLGLLLVQPAAAKDMSARLTADGRVVAYPAAPTVLEMIERGRQPVPADHWSYAALDYLQGCGLLDCWECGYFDGSCERTHSDFRAVIGELLEQAEQPDWETRTFTPDGAGEAVSGAYLWIILDSLRTEFSDFLMICSTDDAGGLVHQLTKNPQP